ncbi:hypothetical protein AB3S75_041485 [Citrus x aurantiifolia]
MHAEDLAKIHPNGLLQLTDSSKLKTGPAFFPLPFKFNTSSSRSLSLSINFLFSIDQVKDSSGHGVAFVISPTMDFSQAFATAFLGLLNTTDNAQSTNHIIAVELDTVQGMEFKDIEWELMSTT